MQFRAFELQVLRIDIWCIINVIYYNMEFPVTTITLKVKMGMLCILQRYK